MQVSDGTITDRANTTAVDSEIMLYLLLILLGHMIVFCLLPTILAWYLILWLMRFVKRQSPSKYTVWLLFSFTLLIISSIYIEYLYQGVELGPLLSIPAHIFRIIAVVHLTLEGIFKVASLVDRWHKTKFS